MKEPKVYIVIVTYNAERWIDYSIGKLKDIKTTHQIIVVDNNSPDNTCALINKKFPEVELIKLKNNAGFGKANNLGIKKAYEEGADYILLLNQDAWIETDTLDTLIIAHQNTENYGIISPVHLDGSGNSLDYNFNGYMSSNKNIISDLYLKGRKDLDNIYPARFVNAAIWLLPRLTVKLVGGFNPLFFMYGEDAEYITRCRFHQLKIGIVPRARAYHGRPQADSLVKKEKLSRLTQLVSLVDPNSDLTIGWHIRYLLASSLKASLLFDFYRARFFLLDAYFFFRERKKIIYSKKANKTSSYLYL